MKHAILVLSRYESQSAGCWGNSGVDVSSVEQDAVKQFHAYCALNEGIKAKLITVNDDHSDGETIESVDGVARILR